MRSLNLNGTYSKTVSASLSGQKFGAGVSVSENSRQRFFILKLNFSVLIIAVLLSLPFALSSKMSLFSFQQSKENFQKQVPQEFPLFSHAAKASVKETPLHKLPGIDLFEIEEESRSQIGQKNLNEKLPSESAPQNKIFSIDHLTAQLLIHHAVAPYMNGPDTHIRLRVLRI